MKPPKASMKVMKAWLPRIGSFFQNAIQRSRGGGRIKVGTLMTSTRISHRTKSAAKKSTGSKAFFQENFTGALRADVRGNSRCCQENGWERACGDFPALRVSRLSRNSSFQSTREKCSFTFN